MIEQFPSDWWVFIILGLFAGVVSGTLGLGSGVVFVPALVLLWGFDQKAAQGTALAVMVPMALMGAIRYWRNPQIELNGPVIVLLAMGAVVGAVVGSELAGRLPAGLLRKMFALFLVIVAARMFISSTRPGAKLHDTGPDDRAKAEATEPGGIDDPNAER